MNQLYGGHSLKTRTSHVSVPQYAVAVSAKVFTYQKYYQGLLFSNRDSQRISRVRPSRVEWVSPNLRQYFEILGLGCARFAKVLQPRARFTGLQSSLTVLPSND